MRSTPHTVPALTLPPNDPDLLGIASGMLGFAVAPGLRVEMLCATTGADHEDEEHTLPAGALGVVDRIEYLGAPQGIAVTVVQQVDPSVDPASDAGRSIINVYDEADTPDRFPFRPASAELAATEFKPATTVAEDLLAALEGLTAWGREHTSPRDDNSPHELLIAAQAALARAAEVGL